MLDVNESVDDYLSMTTGSKLIWGVPYYGRTWYTTSNALNAPTVSGATSKAYYYIGAQSLASQYGRKWDSVGKVPWFAYYDSSAGSWVEGYYDDATSLGVKYDMINQRGLAGVGIWHLLMDQEASELWNLLVNKFQKDTVPPAGASLRSHGRPTLFRFPSPGAQPTPDSGVASYSVQVRDLATSTWTPWLTNTTATSGTYPGLDGHSYEFRVSAKDRAGNAQPWTSPMADPGARSGSRWLRIRGGLPAQRPRRGRNRVQPDRPAGPGGAGRHPERADRFRRIRVVPGAVRLQRSGRAPTTLAPVGLRPRTPPRPTSCPLTAPTVTTVRDRDAVRRHRRLGLRQRHPLAL